MPSFVMEKISYLMLTKMVGYNILIDEYQVNWLELQEVV